MIDFREADIEQLEKHIEKITKEIVKKRVLIFKLNTKLEALRMKDQMVGTTKRYKGIEIKYDGFFWNFTIKDGSHIQKTLDGAKRVIDDA